MMGAIVCATRGGAGSRAVQLQAIEKALETSKPLIFLYVVDISAFDELEERLKSAVRAEFHWLGEALLRIALQRAESLGLDAQVVLREGQVKREIERFLRESEADLLLLGAPRDTTIVFGDDAIEQFATAIEKDTDVPVEIVWPEQMSREQKQTNLYERP